MNTRLPGPQRRHSIVQAASRLFADRGYHGVSIDEIAQQVGVSPAILYRHFSSKKELYNTVLLEMASQRENYADIALDSGKHFEDVLASMTKIYINSVTENPDLLRIELQSMLDGNSATGEFFDNRWKNFTDYIEQSLDEKLPQNQQNRELTIVSASLMFQGILREALIQKLVQPDDRLDTIALNTLSNELVRLFLRAIGINKSRLSRKAIIKN